MKGKHRKTLEKILPDLFRETFTGATLNRFSKVWARKFPKPKVRASEFFCSAKFAFSTVRIQILRLTKARSNQLENGSTNTELKNEKCNEIRRIRRGYQF